MNPSRCATLAKLTKKLQHTQNPRGIYTLLTRRSGAGGQLRLRGVRRCPRPGRRVREEEDEEEPGGSRVLPGSGREGAERREGPSAHLHGFQLPKLQLHSRAATRDVPLGQS